MLYANRVFLKIKNYTDFKNFEALSLKVSEKILAIITNESSQKQHVHEVYLKKSYEKLQITYKTGKLKV